MLLHQLFETHHDYGDDATLGDFQPLRRGDTIRVYHGFRDFREAVAVAQHGLTGAKRVPRVYSYESDNNPKGLFVTTSLKIAGEFTGAYGKKCIVEFVARFEELEAPVWPGGGYTVQGQMAQYFGRGAKGRRARQERRRAADAEVAQHYGGNPDFHHITKSDDRALAAMLMANRERQALYVGHLNPDRITFWVGAHQEPYRRMSREEFLAEFGQEEIRSHRVFQPADEFDGPLFLERMTAKFGNHAPEVLQSSWEDAIKNQNPTRAFIDFFGDFLWPRQYVGAMKWMRATWGSRRQGR